MKNCNDNIGNRTRYLQVFSAVPQATAPPSGGIKYGGLYDEVRKNKTGQLNVSLVGQEYVL
jgi:hypothetical protein